MKKIVEIEKYKNYMVVPEFSLKPDSSKIPDISVWKIVRGVPSFPILVIEICNSNKKKDDIKKLTEIMDGIPTIKEAFVIDKDDLQISKIGRTKTNKPSIAKSDSKSDLFKIDFAIK